MIYRVCRNVVSMERLDGETVAINFKTGEYFSFVGAGADILWLIDNGLDREHWPDLLGSAFVGLEWNDVRAWEVEFFVAGLLHAGLIEEVGDEGATGIDDVEIPQDYERGVWVAPSVSGHDDLADLLLIDPIHDTSEEGWPQTREA